MTHDPGEPAPDPKVVLCGLTQGEAAEPPEDQGIPIATVEALDGQHLGAVNLRGIRAQIYSQATLLETSRAWSPRSTNDSPRSHHYKWAATAT